MCQATETDVSDLSESEEDFSDSFSLTVPAVRLFMSLHAKNEQKPVGKKNMNQNKTRVVLRFNMLCHRMSKPWQHYLKSHEIFFIGNKGSVIYSRVQH